MDENLGEIPYKPKCVACMEDYPILRKDIKRIGELFVLSLSHIKWLPHAHTGTSKEEASYKR